MSRSTVEFNNQSKRVTLLQDVETLRLAGYQYHTDGNTIFLGGPTTQVEIRLGEGAKSTLTLVGDPDKVRDEFSAMLSDLQSSLVKYSIEGSEGGILHPKATSVSLAANQSLPAAAPPVVFTATPVLPNGVPLSAVRYQFWTYIGGHWSIARDFDTSNVFTFPTNASGTYSVGCDVSTNGVGVGFVFGVINNFVIS